MTRRAAALLWLVAAACEVDTEPNLDANVTSAQLTVAGTGIDATLAADMTVRIHVGEHADGPRTFLPRTADVFVGETIIGSMNFERPAGFDGSLNPGETETIAFHATGAVLTATARDTVCGAESVTLLFRYETTTAGELEMDTVTTNDVTCM